MAITIIAIWFTLIAAKVNADVAAITTATSENGLTGTWNWYAFPPIYTLGPYNGEPLFVRSQVSVTDIYLQPLKNENLLNPTINFRLDNRFTDKGILVVFMGPTCFKVTCDDATVQANKQPNIGKGTWQSTVGNLGESFLDQFGSEVLGTFIGTQLLGVAFGGLAYVGGEALINGMAVLVDNLYDGSQFDAACFPIDAPAEKIYQFHISRASCWECSATCEGPLKMSYVIVTYDQGNREWALNQLYRQFSAFERNGNDIIWNRDFDPSVMNEMTEKVGLGIRETGYLNLTYRGPSGMDVFCWMAGPDGFSMTPLGGSGSIAVKPITNHATLSEMNAELGVSYDLGRYLFNSGLEGFANVFGSQGMPIPTSFKAGSIAKFGVRAFDKKSVWISSDFGLVKLTETVEKSLFKKKWKVNQWKKFYANMAGGVISATLLEASKHSDTKGFKISNAQNGTTYSIRIDNPWYHPTSTNTLSIRALYSSSREFVISKNRTSTQPFNTIALGDSTIYNFGIRNSGTCEDILVITLSCPGDPTGWWAELNLAGVGKVASLAQPQTMISLLPAEEKYFGLKVKSSDLCNDYYFPVQIDALSPLDIGMIDTSFVTIINSDYISASIADSMEGNYNIGDRVILGIELSDQDGLPIDPSIAESSFPDPSHSIVLQKTGIGRYRFQSDPLSGDRSSFLATFSKTGYRSANITYEITADFSAPFIPLMPNITAGDQQLCLDWRMSSEPSILKYRIYRSSNSGGPYYLRDSVFSPTHQYCDDSLTNGQNYYYRLSAVNEAGIESEYSDYNYGVPRASTALSITARNMISQNGWPNDTVAVLSFDMSSSGNPLTVTVIRVQMTGNAIWPDDIAYASLYEDLNANGALDANEPKVAEIDLGINNTFPFQTGHLIIGASKRHFLVTYRIAQSANTLGSTCYGACMDESSIDAGPYVVVTLDEEPFCTQQGCITNPDNCGPNVFNLLAQPAMIFAPCTPFKITFEAFDGSCHQLPGHRVVAAEIYIDGQGPYSPNVDSIPSEDNGKRVFYSYTYSNCSWADGTHEICARSLDEVGNWGPRICFPVVVAYGKLTTTILSSRSPNLMRGIYGHLNLVYDQGDGFVAYSVSTDNGLTWATPQQVNAVGTLGNQSIARMGTDDIVRAVYTILSGPDVGVWYAERDLNGTWCRIKLSVTGMNSCQYPYIAIDNQNQAHVIWRYTPSLGGYTHMAYRKGSCSGFSSPETIEPSIAGSVMWGSIETDALNIPHVVWISNLETDISLYSATRSGGWTLQQLESIPSASYSDGVPKLLDCSSYMMLLYTNNDEIYIRKRNGGVWSAPVNVSQTTGMPSKTPDLTMTSGGALYAIWSDGFYGNMEIVFSSSTDCGATWSPCLTNISRSLVQSIVPAATKRDFGAEASIVWYEGNTAPFLLQSGRAVTDPFIPNASLKSPESGDTLSGTIDLIGTLSGSSFLSGILLHGVGSNPSDWDTLATFQYPIDQGLLYRWNTSLLQNGKHTLLVIALGSNCINDSAKVSVTVDNSDPTLTNVEHTNTHFSPNSDTIADSTFVGFYLSKQCLFSARVLNPSGSPVRMLLNGINLQAGANRIVWDGKDNSGKTMGDGRYNILMEYTDLWGNIGNPSQVTVVSDTTKPSAIITDSVHLFGTVWDQNFKVAYLYRDTTTETRSDSLTRRVWNGPLWPPGQISRTYKIVVVDSAWNSDSVEFPFTEIDGFDDNTRLPFQFEISQNYPNPFNPITVIEYSVPRKAHVAIKIYNILGRHVATLVNEDKPAGFYKVIWDGSDDCGHEVATGIYLYRFQAGSYVQTRKMMLLK